MYQYIGRARDWLMEDPNNVQTPFGKRIKWLINGKVEEPPPPPFAETTLKFFNIHETLRL